MGLLVAWCLVFIVCCCVGFVMFMFDVVAVIGNLDTTFVVLWLCGKPCFVSGCLLVLVADWFMVVLLDDWLV